MKNILPSSLACLLSCVTLPALAQFEVGDDFTDPARDVSKWGLSDPGSGDSDWVESSGRLNFLAPSPSFSTTVTRVWSGLSPSCSSDWQAGVDVQVSNFPLFEGEGLLLGLSAADAANPDQRMRVSLQVFQADLETRFRQIMVEASGGSGSGLSAGEAATATTAQFRFTYDANCRMLLAGVVGAGGVVRTVASWNTSLWGMNSSSTFQLSVDALAIGTEVGKGAATADNFSIVSKAPSLRGSLQGGDNFNDNSRSTAAWGSHDALVGNGQLDEAVGGLRFSTAGEAGGDADLAARLWLPGAGDLDQPWTAQVDVVLPEPSLADGQEVELGLVVLNLADPGDRATITLNRSSLDGVAPRRILSQIERDGFSFPDLSNEAATASTSLSLRARWDVPTQKLNLEYDANGSVGGFAWTTLAQYGVNTGDSSWEVPASGKFQVGVFGRSLRGTFVPASINLHLDNFLLAAGTIPVKITTIDKSGKEVLLKWKGGKGPFQIQARKLLEGKGWSDIGSPIDGQSGAVPVQGPQAYFRVIDLGQ